VGDDPCGNTVSGDHAEPPHEGPEGAPDSPKSSRRAVDFWIGLLFAAVGVVVLLEGRRALNDPSLHMLERAANPGSTIFFVGTAMAVLGALLAIVGLRAPGNPFKVFAAHHFADIVKAQVGKQVLLVLLMAVYFFVLWNLLPYWLSTLIFLVTAMALFRAGSWIRILAVSAVSTGLILFFFGKLAQVMLP